MSVEQDTFNLELKGYILVFVSISEGIVIYQTDSLLESDHLSIPFQFSGFQALCLHYYPFLTLINYQRLLQAHGSR